MNSRRTSVALPLLPMRWSRELLGASILSDAGYRITYQRMARGGWYNAYAPYGGKPLVSGQLERCVEACELHRAEIRSRGKRWVKAPTPMPMQGARVLMR